MSYSPINSGLKGVLHNYSVFYGNIVSRDLPKRLMLHASSSINLLSSSKALFNIFSMSPKYNTSASYYVNLNSAHFWNAAKWGLRRIRHNFSVPGIFNESGALNFLLNFSSCKRRQGKHVFKNAYSKAARINYRFRLPYFGFFRHFTLPKAVFKIIRARGHLFSYRYFLKRRQSFIKRAAKGAALTPMLRRGRSSDYKSLSIFRSFYVNRLRDESVEGYSNVGL